MSAVLPLRMATSILGALYHRYSFPPRETTSTMSGCEGLFSLPPCSLGSLPANSLAVPSLANVGTNLYTLTQTDVSGRSM